MKSYFRLCLGVAFMAMFFANTIQAQDPATSSSQASTTSVKLQVVLSRYEGDKRVSSLPYTLLLVPGKSGTHRMGAEVPVPTTSGTPSSYTLQQIGSQIEAMVTALPDGRYNLQLTVTDRWSVPPGPQSTVGGLSIPTFRNMTSASQAIMSNGETIQFTSSADKLNNETFKIDVTLTVGNK